MATIKKHDGKKGPTFEMIVSCGYNTKGKQILQRRTWRPEPGMTKAQIKKALDNEVRKFENECRNGQVSSTIKFQEFAELWLKEKAKPEMRATTYERMKQTSVRVYAAIGHLRLDQITRKVVRGFVSDLAFNGINLRTGKKGISRKTVVHHLTFISDVFSYAIECDMVSDNPCRYIKVPKTEDNGPKEREMYSMAEMCDLLDMMTEDKVHLKYILFFTLAFFTGFRRGELLGLEWKDVDWERRTIRVDRTSSYTAPQGIHTADPKTKRSKRVGKYKDHIFDLLAEYKQWQEEEAAKLGSKWKDHDRLFTKWDGTPMNPGTPYGWLHDYCKKKDFRFCNVHSFRHSHSSGLIAGGVDVPTVSADLGHSNNLTTMSIYAHEFQMAQAKPSDVLEQGMADARAKKAAKNRKTTVVQIKRVKDRTRQKNHGINAK